MKDFLGKELKINDEVIYIKNMRTGSSTRRNILFKGKIIDFTNKNVKIERKYNNECFENGGIDLIISCHIVKI